MLSSCLRCRKKSDGQNLRVTKTNKGKLMILSKCTAGDTKKWRFIKEKEASGFLSSLGMKTSLSKITLVGLLLF